MYRNRGKSRCDYYPWSGHKRYNEWIADLNQLKDINGANIFKAVEVDIAGLNSGVHQLVINPFGECIPETSHGIAFKTICRFIRDGGIFVNSGGHPFIYGYDVSDESHHELVKFFPLLNEFFLDITNDMLTIDVNSSTAVHPESLLLNKVFGVEVMFDLSEEGIQGEQEIDIEYKRIIGNVRKIASVYRPSKITSKRIIPLATSNSRFWPNTCASSAIKYRRGFLIHNGFSLNHEREYQIVLDILKRIATRGIKSLAKSQLVN